MQARYFQVPPATKPEPAPLSLPLLSDTEDPSGYLPDAGLVDAVNVALILKQPLLITGEPGTGKTQLARSIAYQLGLDAPLTFETKSTSISKDLFYTFDSIGRFQLAQGAQGRMPSSAFLSFNALGRAIVRACEPERVAHLLSPSEPHPGQRQSVVLIDEIDKAPRDFPNDILNEVERFFFRISELGGETVTADSRYRPIMILTSNSERGLPDAFLRRCVFYNIPFPDAEHLASIAFKRLASRLDAGAPMLRDAIDFFTLLRLPSTGLKKKPGTAELLNWLIVMFELGCDSRRSLRSQAPAAQATMYVLGKHPVDQETIFERFARWRTTELE